MPLRILWRVLTVAALMVPLTARGFFTAGNLRDLAMANAPVLIAAIGMTLVILTGHIDVSIGSVFAICAVLAGLIAKAGWPLPIAVAGAIGIGGMLGAMNGALVSWLRMPSIVVTLASMVALRDGLRWATQGAWIENLPPGFQAFGMNLPGFEAAVIGVAVLLVAGSALALRYLAAGRAVYATGSSENAARLAGLNPKLVVWSAFTALGALTGLAATLNAARFNQIPANTGLGLELRVIAAVVVGGTSIRGGKGTLIGTLMGVVLLGVIGPALTFAGVSAYWEKAIHGIIILVAVASDARQTIRSRWPPSAGADDQMGSLAAFPSEG